MGTTLLLDGRIQGLAAATALAIVDDTVVWTGADSTGRDRFRDADDVLRLHGALVTPAFVDAHVHATSAGLLAGGLDLRGCISLAQCLDLVAQRSVPGTVLWGHGWDEADWPEGRAPSRVELDRAAGQAPVYLSRIDGHSAAVTSALVDRAPAAVDAPPVGQPRGP